MSYVPKKLVNPGLYATGDTFVDAQSKEVYRGPYHSNFDGSLFTGVDSYDPNKRELIPNPSKVTAKGKVQLKSPQNKKYNELNKKNNNLLKYGKDPVSITPVPSAADYKRGSINRYFAKRITEKPNRIIEISREAYISLDSRNGKYNYATWRAYTLLWRISGKNENEVSKTNKITVDKANSQFLGIKSYLRNLTQFYKSNVATPEVNRTLEPTAVRRSRRRRSFGGGRLSPTRNLY